MTLTTIIWVLLPFFIGFSIYLLPKAARYLTLLVALGSVVYGLIEIFAPKPIALQLLDSFGVTLLVDQTSGYFILMNALVSIAIICYCLGSDKKSFFYTQLLVLHGAVNAIFICADLISLYVALEATGIAAFLLITYQRTDRSIWVGLRYLFVSNTAMLFYLIGAGLVYQSSHSFTYVGLADAPMERSP